MRRNQGLSDAQIQELLLRDNSASDEGDAANLGDESDCTDEDFVLEESEGSHTEGDGVESSDQLEESEDSSDDAVAEPSTAQSVGIKGKNGHRWSTKVPTRTGRQPGRNIVLNKMGNKGAARFCKTGIEAWELLFTNEMVEEITLHTNEEIVIRAARYVEGTGYTGPTDKLEIRAFIGILYMAGVLKDSHVNIEEMWSEKFGPAIFRATMSLPRFQFLAICMRFDDKINRPARKKDDRLAAIRSIWDSFTQHCLDYYTPSSCCTVDEQLLGFRGRCQFRVYIGSKPDKYGLKILMMCDSETYYMVSAIPYTGKVNKPATETVPSYYVKTLTESIHGSNRNVTMDNWFTSIPLAEAMLSDHNLTIVGTLRKNKPQIPPAFVNPKGRDAGTSLFAFDREKTLVSYVPKPKKSVVLLSTMHKDDAIDQPTGKPEIITYYNSTKGGVDTFDQLCHNYTTARKTRRWPLRLFFGILDQAGINAMVLLGNANQAYRDDHRSNRRRFLQELSEILVKPHIVKRQEKKFLPNELKMIMAKVSGEDAAGHTAVGLPQPAALATKKRCAMCPRRKDKKTALECYECKKPMCPEHRAMVCVDCFGKQ